jgi:sugar phosphate isomerase/epimerase
MMRSVSTWSLHRTLGQFVAPESAALGGSVMHGAASADGLALLDLPAELRKRGYTTVQICHFHLPSRSSEYLHQLRDALADAGIELEALLIDDGDLTDPATADHVEAWVGEWLDVAVALGAARARVMAGRAEPTPERIRHYAQRLVRLADAHPHVRIVVENWSGLLSNANAVDAVLRETGGSVGLLIDLGNWGGPGKYAELARIAPRAESCHAKCAFDGQEPDREDYRRSLQILKDAGYSGSLTLIYDGADDNEWGQLDVVDELTRSVFA